MEEFNCEKPENSFSDKGFKEINFLPDVEGFWIFECWTKGYLGIHYGENEPFICYKYILKKVENNIYMFLEITENGESYINVLKKFQTKNLQKNWLKE